MRAVCSCLNALLSRLSSEKLRSITLRLDVANAKEEFERLELRRWIPHLLRLPALCELVFVVRRGSGFVARRTITPAFAYTPYEHMLRFYSIETGAEIPVRCGFLRDTVFELTSVHQKEFPPHVIRIPRSLMPLAEQGGALLHEIHPVLGDGLLLLDGTNVIFGGQPVQVEYYTDSEDEETAVATAAE